MAADSAHLRSVSLHLSRVLDEVGLNALTVKARRHTYLFKEQLENVNRRLIGREFSTYHFGSQTEGATTIGMHSDLDVLLCVPFLNVIQDWQDWQQGKVSLLMLQDMTAPGYCRLQKLRKDVPMADQDLHGIEHYTYDSDGKVILKNTWMHGPNLPGTHFISNGPARSEPGGLGFMDTDFVAALHCKSWPTQAQQFIRRQRRHGWPSQNLLQEAVKHGVFLVPVGYKLSPTYHLEWRISVSLTERCLMFSLKTVHIKCYVVLKMLVKTYIEPRARKCISSYHCKTSILYSVENTIPGFWRDDNLLQCVKQCLTMLLTWVTDGFCPQFCIAGANLFAGKVTAYNKNTLQSILQDLIKSNGRALLRVQIDDLGHMMQVKLSTGPSAGPVLNSPDTMALIGGFEFIRHTGIHLQMNTFMKEDKTTNHVSVIRTIYRKIGMCKCRISHLKKYERQATLLHFENLSRLLGSLLASLWLSKGMRVPRIAIQLLHIGAKNDVASILKLASVFYRNGDFRQVEGILHDVEHHVSSNPMQSACRCYNKSLHLTPGFICDINLLRGKKPRAKAKLFAHCVKFSPKEIHCTPPALRNEFFRSVGDDLQQRKPIEDEWMDMAVVDCLPFLFYLQYMTYRQLGKLDLQTLSLNSLDRCLREDHAFGHLETGWSLLGQCQELEQKPEIAITCYRTSLEVRSRNNAANWHFHNMRYMLIRSGYLPT